MLASATRWYNILRHAPQRFHGAPRFDFPISKIAIDRHSATGYGFIQRPLPGERYRRAAR